MADTRLPMNANAVPSYGAADDAGAHDDDTLQQPLPEATQSPLAMAIGTYLQRRALGACVAGLSLVAAGVGAAQLATGGALVWRVPAVAALVSGLLNGLLLWVVWHGPYELLKRVRAIAQRLQQLGVQLTAAAEEHRAANAEQRQQNAEQRQQNAALRDTVELLDQQLKAAEMLRRGMDEMLKRMLHDMGQRHGALSKVMGDLAGEVDRLGEVGEEVRTRLYATLSGLDEAQRAAQDLSARLLEAVTANAAYAREMVQLVSRLEELVEAMNDETFAREVEALVRRLDALGDGGLRERLLQDDHGDALATSPTPALRVPSPVTLTPAETRVLGAVLDEIDDALQRECEGRRRARRVLLGGARAQVASCRSTMARLSQQVTLATARAASTGSSLDSAGGDAGASFSSA